MSVKRVVVLFSGAGSNLENILKKLHKQPFHDFKIEVVKAISNKPKAGGIEIAKKYEVDVEVVDHTLYNSREAFDLELVKRIKEACPDLVVLAGFMRILTPVFTDNVKAINLHPSLLPLFKGGKAIEESFASEMKVAGVSVHKVSSELDGGTILAQKAMDKREGESLENFTNRIHTLEYELLPKTIIDILNN